MVKKVRGCRKQWSIKKYPVGGFIVKKRKGPSVAVLVNTKRRARQVIKGFCS